MRPSTESHLRHEGNLGTQRRAMTLDENSLAHLMTVLTDLYSDEEMAVIREYPINAVDSHKAAGTKRPIEVRLPTNMDPTFIVQDWGLGLSVDEVLNNFAKYGWSSKRETDEEIGMLGLGCKSALTYTNQFTLTAIQNGVKAEVLVSRGEDGVSGVEVIDTSSTTEPNGVTIRVPVHNIENFNKKARKFFSYWRDPILVDGKPVEFGAEDALWLDENVALVADQGWQHQLDTIVMGNIAYPVESSHSMSDHLRYRAVVWVDVGDINFTPSREALHYTKRTIDTLDTASRFIRDRLHQEAQKNIDEAETHSEAVRRMSKWAEAMGITLDDILAPTPRGRSVPFTYRGTKPPHYLRVQRDGEETPGWVYTPSTDTAGRLGDKQYHMRTGAAVQTIWVTGHLTKTVSRRQRNQLRGYFLQRESPTGSDGWNSYWNRVMLVRDTQWAGPWLEGTTIDWDEIEAVDPIPPYSSTPVQRTDSGMEPEYLILTKEQRLRSRTAPNTARTVYTSPADLNSKSTDSNVTNRREGIHLLVKSERIKPPYKVVLIHPRSFNRFKREHPKALSMQEALVKEMKALKRRLTPIQQGAIIHRAYTGAPPALDELARLDPSNLDDPDVARIIRETRQVSEQNLWRTWRTLERSARSYMASDLPKLDDSQQWTIEPIISKYPLLSNIRGATPKDVEDYINSMYHRQEQA